MAKNTKNIIVDAGSLLLSILVIVMMSVPFFKQFYAGSQVDSRNVFSLINFDGSVKMIAAVTSLILAIAVIVLAVLAVLKLLNSFGVIKNEMLNKCVNIASLVCAVIVAIASIVLVIAIVNYCNDNWYATLQTGLRPVIASMVFIILFGVASVATTVLTVKNN